MNHDCVRRIRPSIVKDSIRFACHSSKNLIAHSRGVAPFYANFPCAFSISIQKQRAAFLSRILPGNAPRTIKNPISSFRLRCGFLVWIFSCVELSWKRSLKITFVVYWFSLSNRALLIRIWRCVSPQRTILLSLCSVVYTLDWISLKTSGRKFSILSPVTARIKFNNENKIVLIQLTKVTLIQSSF